MNGGSVDKLRPRRVASCHDQVACGPDEWFESIDHDSSTRQSSPSQNRQTKVTGGNKQGVLPWLLLR